MENNELQHHGITGMKWGIRRYQNKDGSLTKAGKKRYDKEVASLKEQQRIVNNKKRTQAKMDKLADMRKKLEDDKAALNKADAERKMQKANKKAAKRKLSEIPNDELMEKINRLQLEQRYIDLDKARHPQQDMQKDKSLGKKFKDEAVKPAIVNAGKNLLEKTLNKYGAEMLGLNEKQVKTGLDKLKEEADIAFQKHRKVQFEDQLNDRLQKRKEAKATAKNEKGKFDAHNADRTKNEEQRYHENETRKSSEYRSGPKNDSSVFSVARLGSGSSYTSTHSNQTVNKSHVDKGRDFTNVLFRGRMADGTEYTIEDRY